MTHTEAERACMRTYEMIKQSRDGLVRDLLATIKTATTLVDDLLTLDDASAPDLVFRLDRYFGKHTTALADVATLRGRLDELAELYAVAADLEAQEIAEQDRKDAEDAAWHASMDEAAMRWGTR